MVKKLLPRSGACHACRGLSSNSAGPNECVWTNLQDECRSLKCVNFNVFYDDGIAEGRHLPSVPANA